MNVNLKGEGDGADRASWKARGRTEAWCGTRRPSTGSAGSPRYPDGAFVYGFYSDFYSPGARLITFCGSLRGLTTPFLRSSAIALSSARSAARMYLIAPVPSWHS